MNMFLATAAEAVSATDFQSVLTAIQGQISVANIVSVLGIAVGAAVGFAFMWWGVRKLITALMNGFRKGKVGV